MYPDKAGNYVLNGKPSPKGYLGGLCNRTSCNNDHAHMWSSVECAYYCIPCARRINEVLPSGVALIVAVPYDFEDID